VLERPCPECGFESSKVPRDQIPELIGANALVWVEILAGNPGRLRRRPREDRWSVLEYACHVRDVFRVMDKRLNLMLSLDESRFENWDQDQTAEQDNYGDQAPAAVATELSAAAETLAEDFGGIEDNAWQRRGMRSDDASFTVETIGQFMLHDVVHHVHDVTSDLAAPASRSGR
jgi:hypothetical protein